MKPAFIDRVFVICIAAALVVWAGCLVILWGRAFDPGGASLLITLAATMLAIWATARLPGRAARGAGKLLSFFRLQGVPGSPGRSLSRPGASLVMQIAAAGAARGGKREVRAMVHLLGASTIFAAGCALVSTVAVSGGWFLAEYLAERGLWTLWDWPITKFLVQFVGMIPMGLGISVTFLAAAVLRSGSARDA
ncbi:MAG: hypothetical protein KAU28_07305, partial [Phycisphaerae bacterium]|nr:hypothetical protein [Phycisphaerae bacterium]